MSPQTQTRESGGNAETGTSGVPQFLIGVAEPGVLYAQVRQEQASLSKLSTFISKKLLLRTVAI